MKLIIYLSIISLLFTSCTKREVIVVETKIKKVPKQIKKEVKPINIIPKEIIKEKTNIAIVYSSNSLGKYLIKISDISSLYMLNTKEDFSLKYIDINNKNLMSVLDTLKDDNISNVMIYIEKNNLEELLSYEDLEFFDIYLPLINNKQNQYKNIVFGGIDYDEQLKLIKSIAHSHIIEVYDNNKRNKKLHNILDKSDVTSYLLSGKYPNYKKFLEKHPLIKDSTLILNLNIVKSSILLSQITANEDLNITQAISVQNNYTPLLFVLTQVADTKKLVIANSITHMNKRIHDLNKLNTNNLKYNWVNYSTILGLEYLKYKKDILFGEVKIVNNQINYKTKLYKTKKKSFVLY
jgi:hypothetical protein